MSDGRKGLFGGWGLSWPLTSSQLQAVQQVSQIGLKGAEALAVSPTASGPKLGGNAFYHYDLVAKCRE